MSDWIDRHEERQRRSQEEHQKEREVLFGSESFLIGMLQVVSGGSLFAGLAQMSPLVALAGQLTFLVFLTLMAVALVTAVVAAYFKHEYKLWDVKGRVVARRDEKEAQGHFVRAIRCVGATHLAMRASVLAVAVGIGSLLIASWAHYLRHHPHQRSPAHSGSIPAHVSPSAPRGTPSGPH